MLNSDTKIFRNIGNYVDTKKILWLPVMLPTKIEKGELQPVSKQCIITIESLQEGEMT